MNLLQFMSSLGTECSPFLLSMLNLETAQLRELQIIWKPRVKKKFIQVIKSILSNVRFLENPDNEVRKRSVSQRRNC